MLDNALKDLLLAIADDKFFLGCRNSDWTGLGPMIEEDIAFSALAQDDIAHAKELYEWIARQTDDDANRIAHGRKVEEYRCAQIVELSDEFDWAFALVRQFFCDHFDELRLRRLAKSSNQELRELGERMLAEERLALGHADGWILRLGRGTAESRERLQTALDKLAPHACMLFEKTADADKLADSGVYPPLAHDMFDMWATKIESAVEAANLEVKLDKPNAAAKGGRAGVHSEHFAPWLTELTEVYREEPEATW
ncbi:MAG: 1,2-phenylacetyl-CoA epoxidase subunit PaaC [Phycisphaerae bacterium]